MSNSIAYVFIQPGGSKGSQQVFATPFPVGENVDLADLKPGIAMTRSTDGLSVYPAMTKYAADVTSVNAILGIIAAELTGYDAVTGVEGSGSVAVATEGQRGVFVADTITVAPGQPVYYNADNADFANVVTVGADTYTLIANAIWQTLQDDGYANGDAALKDVAIVEFKGAR